MQEFVRISLVSRAGESLAEFRTRLSEFWTKMLRERPDDFEKVYAEATEFEESQDGIRRHYLVEPDVVPILERACCSSDLRMDPVDWEDTYNKYEAVPPEWWQIEH